MRMLHAGRHSQHYPQKGNDSLRVVVTLKHLTEPKGFIWIFHAIDTARPLSLDDLTNSCKGSAMQPLDSLIDNAKSYYEAISSVVFPRELQDGVNSAIVCYHRSEIQFRFAEETISYG